MDASGLIILLKEMEADCAVARDAAQKAARGLRITMRSEAIFMRSIQRLALDIEGIRPAFIPKVHFTNVRELKAFRHVMRHAYDLALRQDRLAELSAIADRLAAELPGWCVDFGNRVSKEQGWESTKKQDAQ